MTKIGYFLIELNNIYQEKIITLIIKRGMRGPLIKPQGIGEPLRDGLKGYTKIKSRIWLYALCIVQWLTTK